MWTHWTLIAVTKDFGKTHLVPILTELKKGDDPTKIQALTAIALLGEKAKPLALPAVEAALDDQTHTIGVTAMHTLVAMHALESKSTLKKIVDDKKAPEFFRDAAEDTIHALEHNDKVMKEQKDKKTPDKK